MCDRPQVVMWQTTDGVIEMGEETHEYVHEPLCCRVRANGR
jgi:hypothetical protein